MAELAKFSRLRGIGVEGHDGDVRFKSGSGNMADSCMRNASGHNYRNRLVVVDLAMRQIPRSTERISSSGIILQQIYSVNGVLNFVSIARIL